ncbi:hypothetical protein [Arthrobacter zhaoguopingii]|uniref:hypothetical protein n=1 Tax=Arthrobacter zhaoguopingii TaxID=2681491 RepID=UPI001AEDB5C2|nr:hypothetical protein [Arthrobacter zhaoguopingii]
MGEGSGGTDSAGVGDGPEGLGLFWGGAPGPGTHPTVITAAITAAARARTTLGFPA